MKHDKYWKLLEKIAIASEPVARTRLAACLVYKNELLAVGFNKNKTHPIAKRFQKTEGAEYLHAEISALISANNMYDEKIIAKSTLYVLRIKKSDRGKIVWGLAKPCNGCMKAIKHYKIKNVLYTNNCDEEIKSFTTMVLD